jgi:hypothetical protein
VAATLLSGIEVKNTNSSKVPTAIESRTGKVSSLRICLTPQDADPFYPRSGYIWFEISANIRQ